MKIHLFNNFYNGDLFFNQPIVKNICKNNPEHIFTMFCNYNTYIFRDIPNLNISTHVPYTPDILYTITNDILIINLWIGSLFNNKHITHTTQEDIECNVHNYIIAFKNLLAHIKDTTGIIINLDNFTEDVYLPVIPFVDISDFKSWNKSRDNSSKLIYYPNYYPKSGQQISINNHDDFIYHLALTYPNYIFLVPKLSEQMREKNISNIIDCETKFNCKETNSCENLCKLQKIIEECNYSIHFDIGACFYYINSMTPFSKNSIIHIGVSDFYYKNMIKNFPSIIPKTTFLYVDNIASGYLKLRDILDIDK